MKPARALAIVVVIGALLVGGYIAKQLIWSGASTTITTQQVEARIVTLINAKRQANGLKPLVVDVALRNLALAHSEDMLAQGYFAHDTPTGGTFALRTKRLGRPLVEENIAWGTGGFARAAGIVSLWMASSEHRKIILTIGLKRIGVGVVAGTFEGQSGARVATADFSS